MSTAVRDARLKGAKAAYRTLDMLEARARLDHTHGQIDVFDALADMDIMVMFKPLDGLLGAYLRGSPPGVLISTKRPYSVQRFTAAHELGHAILEHEPSLDTPDVLRRAATGRFGGIGKFAAHLQEVEADAFAGEFLMPRWLLAHHAATQGWSPRDFENPAIVYQLSLRCGASFDATTRTLERNRVVSSSTATLLRKIKPKALKAELRQNDTEFSPWSDTWVITEKDQKGGVRVREGDVVGLRLIEHGAGGYRWCHNAPSELATLSDDTFAGAMIGGASERSLVFKCRKATRGTLRLVEKRPWETEGCNLDFPIQVLAPEEGLSSATKRRLIHA